VVVVQDSSHEEEIVQNSTGSERNKAFEEGSGILQEFMLTA
jgi:hypothetical protein